MTLQQAQAAFRHSPGRATALAYMDAAIEVADKAPNSATEYALICLEDCCKEIRDWLMNERVP